MEVTPLIKGAKVLAHEESSSMSAESSEVTKEVAGRTVHEKSSSKEAAESLHLVQATENARVESSSRSSVTSSTVVQSSSFSSSSVLESSSISSLSASERLLSSSAAAALEQVKRLEF